MKFQVSILIIITAALFACNNADSPNINSSPTRDSVSSNKNEGVRDQYLITDSSIGNITSATTYADLELFYKNDLTEEISYGAEGLDSFMVTKIFKDTPKEFTIIWKEGQHHKKISAVEIFAEDAPYYTVDSLKIGSTLNKLLQVNEKPINFYGTGWDYGGYISSYNHGKLDESNLVFQLTGKEDLDERLMGDQELNTNMPLVKQNLNKLYIYKITLSFK